MSGELTFKVGERVKYDPNGAVIKLRGAVGVVVGHSQEDVYTLVDILDEVSFPCFTDELALDWSESCEVNKLENASVKDSNPKDAIGIKKVPFSTVPSQVIAEVGLGMLEGAVKYGRHNYRVIGVRTSVYYDAAMRHLTAFWEGEDIDQVSGLPHLVKAMSSLAVLRDAQIQGKVTDDRPPKNPSGWVDKLNEKAKEIIEKFPNPPEPYTEEKK